MIGRRRASVPLREASSPGLPAVLVMVLPATLTFLASDAAQRFSTTMLGLSLGDWVVNATTVGLAAAFVTLAAGLLLWALGRFVHPEIPRFGAAYLFYSVNLLFIIYGTLPVFELPYSRPLGILLALVPLALHPLLRSRLESIERWCARQSSRVLAAVGAGLTAGMAASIFVAFQAAPAVSLPDERPNVIIVTFDGLAAQHMSLFGYERETTPELDAFAAESADFRNAHSLSNVTVLSLPRVQGYYTRLPKNFVFSDWLLRHGWRSAAFLSFWKAEMLHVVGIDSLVANRSFEASPIYRALRGPFNRQQLIWLAELGSQEESYFNPYLVRAQSELFWRRDHYRSDVAFENAIDHLRRHPGGTFLWVHIWAPHSPFDPDPQFRGMFGASYPPQVSPPLIHRSYSPEEQALVNDQRDVYDAYVKSADKAFGDFIGQLRASNLYRNSIIVVSSDHGESFQNGYVGHLGPFVRESLTHVPLLIRFPDLGHGATVASPASHVDVAPTVLDYLGIQPPEGMPGESLLPYLAGERQLSPVPRFSVSNDAIERGVGEAAVHWRGYKLVFRVDGPRQARLYHLLQDPAEQHDLARDRPELVHRMRSMWTIPLADIRGPGGYDAH
ncbi:MAG: sulfatase-like hydrolase/transferase [Armatimonadetes bacterium]|nr:sulfatase-like hydrolase/transferase [Armatimonadota bacterium]